MLLALRRGNFKLKQENARHYASQKISFARRRRRRSRLKHRYEVVCLAMFFHQTKPYCERQPGSSSKRDFSFVCSRFSAVASVDYIIFR